jgi:hypothetical protein
MTDEKLIEANNLSSLMYHLDSKIKQLSKVKSEIESIGFIKLDNESFYNDRILVPFEVLKEWFDQEYIRLHNEFVDLKIKFDEL